MSDNTPVNSQITDSVTQANVKTELETPAILNGSLLDSQALSNAIHNATNNEPDQSYVDMMASLAQGLTTLRSIDIGAIGDGAEKHPNAEK